MGKATQIEKIKRVNMALAILKNSESKSQAVITMAQQQHLSKRQAYRYINEATQLEQSKPVPSQKVAFTVKLPTELLDSLRKNAQANQCSLSELTARTFFRPQKSR